MHHQLEVTADNGDETFAGLRYLVSAVPIPDQGLSVQEGEPSVSSSLASIVKTATVGGYITILRRPYGPYLGYALTTSAIIDRANHSVSGDPLGYADGRSRLAWYPDSNIEAERETIETGSNSQPRAVLTLATDYVIGSLEVTAALVTLLARLELIAGSLGPVDLSLFDEAVAEVITLSPNFTQSSLSELAHGLVTSTVEAIVLSRLRLMRWQGLTLLGYSFSEDGQPIKIEASTSLDEQRRHLDQLEAALKTQTFLIGGLAWLKPHVTTAIAIMRTELNDALPTAPK